MSFTGFTRAELDALTKEESLKVETLFVYRAYLKHGPRGLGGPGPCDPDCAKCGVDLDLENLQKRVRDRLRHDGPSPDEIRRG